MPSQPLAAAFTRAAAALLAPRRQRHPTGCPAAARCLPQEGLSYSAADNTLTVTAATLVADALRAKNVSINAASGSGRRLRAAGNVLTVLGGTNIQGSTTIQGDTTIATPAGTPVINAGTNAAGLPTTYIQAITVINSPAGSTQAPLVVNAPASAPPTEFTTGVTFKAGATFEGTVPYTFNTPTVFNMATTIAGPVTYTQKVTLNAGADINGPVTIKAGNGQVRAGASRQRAGSACVPGLYARPAPLPTAACPAPPLPAGGPQGVWRQRHPRHRRHPGVLQACGCRAA